MEEQKRTVEENIEIVKMLQEDVKYAELQIKDEMKQIGELEIAKVNCIQRVIIHNNHIGDLYKEIQKIKSGNV